MYCSSCGHHNHYIQDCHYLKKQITCDHCGKKGHIKKDCWGITGKPSNLKQCGDPSVTPDTSYKQPHKEETNKNLKEIITFGAQEMSLNDNSMDKDGNKEFNVNGTDPNEEHILYYDWLADSTTTAHVTNQREAFTTYEPANDATIAGVGNSKTMIEGCGTILLESHQSGQTFVLHLENVLYIPTNWNSLLSLGRWYDTGGSYKCHSGKLILMKDGRVAAKGDKIKNNLYKLNIQVHKPKVNSTNMCQYQRKAHMGNMA
jgi:hypothetical protein